MGAFATDGLQVTEDLSGATWMVAVAGELDLHTAPALCARLSAHRGERVVVDLTDLLFCDSAGLRALLGEARETRFQGGRMTLVAPDSTPVRRLLDMTGLSELLRVHGDRGGALAAS